MLFDLASETSFCILDKLSATFRAEFRLGKKTLLATCPLPFLQVAMKSIYLKDISETLCDQSFLNVSAYSADEGNVKVQFKHPSTTFVYSKT